MAAQSVPVRFKSVVIKRRSIERRHHGGARAFDAAFPSARNDGGLSILVAMSLNGANHLFARLPEAGLEPGRDFGLVDMHVGVLIPCDDVKVTQEATGAIGLPPPRYVELSEGHRHVPVGIEMTWHPNLPQDPSA